jgi:hypothetical protein
MPMNAGLPDASYPLNYGGRSGHLSMRNTIDEMKKVLNETDDIHKHAAILALKSSESDAAKKLLDQNSDLLKSVEEKEVTWEDIGREFENK